MDHGNAVYLAKIWTVQLIFTQLALIDQKQENNLHAGLWLHRLTYLGGACRVENLSLGITYCYQGKK